MAKDIAYILDKLDFEDCHKVMEGRLTVWVQ
jgi:hypothetical protein